MNGLFITGTDTGVGKTLVTATLIAWWRSRGQPALPMKPVQTGWPAADDLVPSLLAAGVKVTPALTRRLSPFRFRLAASPHLATRRAPLSVSRIARACRVALPAGWHIAVEGAGGVLVPLNRRETMRDLMVALGLPVLLVARAGLGTLNHTLLSLDSLRSARLKVAGVILNQLPGQRWGVIEQDNLETLAARADCPVVRFKPVRFPTIGKSLAVNFQSLEKLAG